MKRRGFLAALLAAPVAAKAASHLRFDGADPIGFTPVAPSGLVHPRGNIIMRGPLWECISLEGIYSYHCTYAIAIRRGPFTTTQAWRNGRLVMDLDNPSANDRDVMGRGMGVYQGTEHQMPNVWLEALPPSHGGGVGNVPSFRGLAYMVICDDLTDTCGRIPEWRFA